jgi:hypothetical protein
VKSFELEWAEVAEAGVPPGGVVVDARHLQHPTDPTSVLRVSDALHKRISHEADSALPVHATYRMRVKVGSAARTADRSRDLKPELGVVDITGRAAGLPRRAYQRRRRRGPCNQPTRIGNRCAPNRDSSGSPASNSTAVVAANGAGSSDRRNTGGFGGCDGGWASGCGPADGEA